MSTKTRTQSGEFGLALPSKLTLRPIDIFVLLNTFLFLLLCVFTYYDRFVSYRGAANIHEFFIYASAILASIAFLWFYFRHYKLETGLLVLLEIGILMHFSGAFVQFDGYRLYDVQLLGIRYDKYVHFVNAFIGAALIWKLCSVRKVPLHGVNILIVPLVVLGLGSIIEMLEYMVVVTVESNGVGGYDNNMQDLIANLFGSSIYVCLIRFKTVLLQEK